MENTLTNVLLGRELEYKKIKSKKYKYELTKDIAFKIPKPKILKVIDSEYFSYDSINGILYIFKGYQWDGASGPAIDTQNFMRGSLLHDCLYQLMRENFIDKKYRKTADKLLVKICREDGMSYLRSEWVYYGVRCFGWLAIRN